MEALLIEVSSFRFFQCGMFAKQEFILSSIGLGTLRVIFSENRELDNTHKKSIFLLFRLNIPLSDFIQGNIV